MSIFFANQQTIKKDNISVGNISSNRSSTVPNIIDAFLDNIPYQNQLKEDVELCSDCALPSGLTYSSECSNPSDPPTWIPNPDYSPPATPTPTPSPTPTPTPSPSASSTPTPSIP